MKRRGGKGDRTGPGRTNSRLPPITHKNQKHRKDNANPTRRDVRHVPYRAVLPHALDAADGVDAHGRGERVRRGPGGVGEHGRGVALELWGVGGGGEGEGGVVRFGRRAGRGGKGDAPGGRRDYTRDNSGYWCIMAESRRIGPWLGLALLSERRRKV